jgi:hypothetical protein
VRKENDDQVDAAADGPRFSRAVLALVAAATLAVAPVADKAVGPAASGDGAHSSPVYLLAQAAHDIGHNDWAFQGGVAGRVGWAVGYAALGLFWLGVALWVRRRGGRTLSIRVLIGAWGTIGVALAATLLGALSADQGSSPLDPVALRLVDACSPWWSCVAVLAVAASTEHNRLAGWAAAGYGALLGVLLLVPIAGADGIKVLVLGLAAAVAALLEPEDAADASGRGGRLSPPDAVAAG